MTEMVNSILKQLTLKQKNSFLDWAIDRYKKADRLHEYDGRVRAICLELEDYVVVELNIYTCLLFDQITKTGFPELSKEIDIVLQKTHNRQVICWSRKSYFNKGRINLLKRVYKQINKKAYKWIELT